MITDRINTVEMKVFQARWFCSCGGEFLPTGAMLDKKPIQYQHQCNKCPRIVSGSTNYPRLIYKPVT